MAMMFENVKKGDSVLLSTKVRLPGTHSMMVWNVSEVQRVYQNTFVVDSRKYYKQDGSNAGGRDSWNDHSKVRPLEGHGARQSTIEEECQLNKNIQSLGMVEGIAQKLAKRNNVTLVNNAERCDAIRAAVLEINKLLQETE